MNMILLLIIVLLIGIGVIAGICFLLYFLYKKHEENKHEKELTDYEE